MPNCPIPACKKWTAENSLVCGQHGVQIWGHIETVRDKSGFAELVDVERDGMQRQAEDNARAVAAARARGWIYFLELDEKIKVGWTSNLANRLKSYPPHARMLVQYPATRADERDLHRTLRTELLAGREWYGRTPLVLGCMREAQLAEDRRKAAEYEASRPVAVKMPGPIRRTRPPRGQALVRAILAGEDT